MVLIFIQHINRPKAPVTAGQNENSTTTSSGVDRSGRINPLQRPQGGTGGPTQIEPPIGGSLGADGAPTPIRVTSGTDPRSVRPMDPASAPPLVTEVPPSLLQPSETDPLAASNNAVSPGAVQQPTQVETTPPLIAGTSSNAGQQPRQTGGTGTPSLVPWDAPPQQPAAQQQTRQSLTAQATQARSPQQSQTPQTQPVQTNRQTSQAAQNQLSDKGTHSLKNLALQITGDKIRVRIEADDAFPCKSFILTGPDRLVIDLPGTWKGMKVPSVPQNDIVKTIRHGKQATGPRLVLDLSKTLKNHSVQRSGNVVEIVLQ